MGSPTYGTDKTANEQLMSDVSGILSFRPKPKPPIDYTPRPELVKPAKGEETLPSPQDSVVSSANPDWPESPEQRLARVRADAEENADNPSYNSPVVPDMALEAKDNFKKPGEPWRKFESGNESVGEEAAKKAEFDKRLKETREGSSTTRKFLSDPPLDYRQASADAPVGELGEDEYRKERRLKRLARKNTSWLGDMLEDVNPF